MIKKFLFQTLFKKFNNITLNINLKPKNIDFEGKKCLCLAPHPDDEAIGLGGVLNLYPQNFKVILLTNGAKGIPDKSETETIEIRAREFECAMNYTGINNFETLNIQDKELLKAYDTFKNINFSEFDYIFLPNLIDQHPDHKAVSILLAQAIQKGVNFKKDVQIVFYEVWSALPFANIAIDIEDVIDKKQEMINQYPSQTATKDYNYHILGLNQYRGIFKNKKFMEAFFVMNKEDFLEVCKLYQ